MEGPRLLKGEELIARGITRVHATLPTIGLKEVIPNKTWLEAKQTQSALEARKQLVQVERIEKRANLSHAIWRDDLGLAEVTRKIGSYWQYLGHNIGKILYLLPEETLLLIELNCLLLTHNEVTVSLQKAYTLCLGDITINQYKVYAALSRLGYRVFRHKDPKVENDKKDIICDPMAETQVGGILDGIKVEVNEDNIDNNQSDTVGYETLSYTSTTVNSEQEAKERLLAPDDTLQNINDYTPVECKPSSAMDIDENAVFVNDLESTNEGGVSDRSVPFSEPLHGTVNSEDTNDFNLATVCQILKTRLANREPNIRKADINKYFNNFPSQTQEVYNVDIPNEEYLPRNIFLHKSAYVMNVKTLSRKGDNNDTSSTRSDSASEGMRAVSSPSVASIETRIAESNFVNHHPHFSSTPRHFQRFIRTPNYRNQFNYTYDPYNIFFQRPPLSNFVILPRYPPYHTYPYPRMNFSNQNRPSTSWFRGNYRKRSNPQTKSHHLYMIKNLAMRFKNLAPSARIDVIALTKLIDTYNQQYGEKIRLAPNYEIIEEGPEVIDLDDEEVESKRPRLIDKDSFKNNLSKLKALAAKLKHLDAQNKSSSRHRRVLSNAVKMFNKYFSAEMYLNSKFEIIDRNLITLDSSSDSDVVIVKEKSYKKKLRNPFHILKRLPNNNSSQENLDGASTSQVVHFNLNEIPKENVRERLLKYLTENWIPDDFGKPELCSKESAQLIEVIRHEYLLEHSKVYKTLNNWVELKLSLLNHFEDSIASMENQVQVINQDFRIGTESQIRSIIGPNDCSDIKSVLEMLRIIPTSTETGYETNLQIDFDVYNRDVVDFRKTNPPNPHFRVVCLSDSSHFPSGMDVAALQGKCVDNIAIVFAVVGIASVSYLQITHIDTPVYIPNNDLA